MHPLHTRPPRRPGLSPLALSALLAGGTVVLGGCPTAETCPAGGEGITHTGTIVADETWRAEDGPHRIEGTLAVRDGATLTLDACTLVELAPAASLELGGPGSDGDGHLVANGEDDRRVRFTASGDAAWGAVVSHGASTVELRHTTLEHGGAASATLVALGLGSVAAGPTLDIDDVEIKSAQGHGVILAGAARFTPTSSGLTIVDSGDDERPEPLVVDINSLEGLPEGAYAGNAVDEIVIVDDNDDAQPGLQRSTTLRDLGVPYRFRGAPGDDFRVGASGRPLVTLTLEAGVELRLPENASLRMVSDAEAPRGRLVAKGIATSEVVIRSVDDDGSFTGLYFESPMADHDVAFARIENAGGDCSCSLTSCSPLAGYDGAVILDGKPDGVFMHDSVIVNSRGHGFVRSWVDHEDIDFLADNTVEDAVGCAQTMPELGDEVCPDAAYACGN